MMLIPTFCYENSPLKVVLNFEEHGITNSLIILSFKVLLDPFNLVNSINSLGILFAKSL